MPRRRRSYEAGHKPKYLVIIDGTPECDRAVYYASRRAARTGAGVLMLLVIEPEDRHQQWLGVADIMKAEAHVFFHWRKPGLERGEPIVLPPVERDGAERAAGQFGERVVRDGEKAQEILNLIEADEDIATLVLAAGTGKDGPGPLVSNLGKTVSNYPIPVAIVPGHLSDEDLDALS